MNKAIYSLMYFVMKQLIQLRDYNFDDFSTQEESQNFFEKVGDVSNDLNRLDGDKDGIVCETLK